MKNSDLPPATDAVPRRAPVPLPNLPPDPRSQVAHALARLTLGDQVGLAMRDHRSRLGLSQRAYAAMRNWGRSTLARFEADADGCRLRDVVDALQGTGFALALVRLPQGPRTPGGTGPLAAAAHQESWPGAGAADAGVWPHNIAPEIVDPLTWPVVELIARTRGMSRRFPAHRETTYLTMAPMWWWVHEYFTCNSELPVWCAPRWLPPPADPAPKITAGDLARLTGLESCGAPDDDVGNTGEAKPRLRLIKGCGQREAHLRVVALAAGAG